MPMTASGNEVRHPPVSRPVPTAADMEARLSVDVDRPIGHVFECTNDHVCEWSETCVSEEVIEDTGGGGTRFRILTRDRGCDIPLDGLVTAWDPPRYAAIHLTGAQFDIDVDYTFEEREGGTRVTQHSIVRGKGMTRVMFFLLGWLMRRSGCDAQRKELDGLESFGEARG